MDSGVIGSHDEDLNLCTGGTPHMTIMNANGNVGIGTATPEARLEVDGDAYVTGVILVNPAGDLAMGAFTNGVRP